MASGTFTYNALLTKSLKESFKLDKSNAASIGTTSVKPNLSICPVALASDADILRLVTLKWA